MDAGRRKLICLLLSHVARRTADCVVGVLITLAVLTGADRDGAWTVAVLFLAPAVLLAPITGALCNGIAKQGVLLGSATLVFTATLGLPADDWAAAALVAVAAALYGPARDALLPAAADDTRWPLSRLNAVFQAGTAVAVIAGVGIALAPTASPWHSPGVEVAALGALAMLLAFPVRFAGDVRRPAAPLPALRAFFADARTIVARRESRVGLVGLAGVRAAIAGLVVALVPRVPDMDDARAQASVIGVWIAWFMIGTACGALLAGVQPHPRRVLGLVPPGMAALAAALAWAATADEPSMLLLLTLGLTTGLVNVPLATTYQSDLPPDARGSGMALRSAVNHLAAAAAALAVFAVPPELRLGLLAVATGLGAVVSVWDFRRELGEQLVELLFFAMYRFHAAGPGLDRFPRRGPVLVIANHSAWLDPCWLAKVLPRSIIAMMTNVFFDTPALRWLMVHVVHAIRVHTGKFRRDLREVPELREAVAALDRGECLLVFPEGAMRRGDDRPLRMFGQGVWHILRERPETPVVVCWIEGGWGSFFSYRGGPPTRNKRFDWLRPIRIAVEAPRPIDPEVLADQRRTRVELMRACLQARRWLGLEPLALPEETYSTEEERAV